MIKKFNKIPLQNNIDIAISELENNTNNCVAHVYNDVKVNTNGPLAGVPITVKNLFATNDAPTDSHVNYWIILCLDIMQQ